MLIPWNMTAVIHAVDIAIAFLAAGLEGLGHQPRADIAALETDGITL
jgi:hypothetical protein